MKEDARTAVKHEFEHAEPTVIHDPEQDMTILARWVHRGIEKGPRFWYLLGGVLAVVVVVTVLANGLSRGKSATGQAWSELAFAQTPGQKVEIAETFANSEAARVARLQAAADYFFQATRDLPNNRESALPQLKKALDLFLQVARESPKESPEAVVAAFGAARTLEARNELPEAIQQYKAVASDWPGTPEAAQAQTLATRLQEPEVVAFYKELYTYKPPTALSPIAPGFPGLSGGLPAGHPALNGPTVTAPPLTNIAPLPSIDLKPAGPGPIDIAPPPETTPGPRTAPAPVATPAPAPVATPVGKSELPANPFAPPAAKPDAAAPKP